MDSRSKKILVALVALFLVAGGAYVAVAALGPDRTTTEARPEASEVLAQTDLMVRAVDPANPRLNGRVYEVDDGKVKRRSTDLACERVYYAGGRGICMGVAASGVDYEATIFDSELRPQHDIPLTGFPSRARVSDDGRLGAMTVFVSGDSYATSGFSTRSGLYEVESKTLIKSIEELPVFIDGGRYFASDAIATKALS